MPQPYRTRVKPAGRAGDVYERDSDIRTPVVDVNRPLVARQTPIRGFWYYKYYFRGFGVGDVNAPMRKSAVQRSASERDDRYEDEKVAIDSDELTLEDLRPATTRVSVDGLESEPLRERFARNLRLLRAERAMSQAEMVEVTGFSRALISRAESGRYAVGLDTVERFAEILEVEASVLIDPLYLSGRRPSLRELRESKGFSQSKLAQESGISRVTINRIEVGKTVPGPRAKRAIAEVLGVDPSAII